MKLKEEDVQSLLASLKRYFVETTRIEPEFQVPYNLDVNAPKQPLLDYTGHIGITGSHKGGLVITCAKELVQKFVSIVLVTDEPSEDDTIAMVGEMANTIAGNARVHFGAQFDISVPSVIVGVPDEFKFLLAEPTLVVPFTWNGSSGNAILGIT